MDINVASIHYSSVTQSSTYDHHQALLAIDGDMSTDMHSGVTDDPKWWKWSFFGSLFITRIVIYTPNGKNYIIVP